MRFKRAGLSTTGCRLAAGLAAVVASVALLAVSGCGGESPAAVVKGRPPGERLGIGIAYGDVLPFLSGSQLGAELDDAVNVGATWIRVDLAWDDVQPVKGPYSWTRFDQVVAAARQRHLSILALLAYTPSWARPKGCGSDKCGPADPATFAAFVSAAVRRYAPMGIHDWEIWNEPNSDGFWRPAPNPSQYGDLVRLSAAVIHSEQPKATVLLGSLAAGKLTGIGIPALTFLKQLCADGINRVVNAIGWHPYSYPQLPTSPDPHNPWNLISRDSPSFESILAQAGTPHLPVWITEYGAPTGGPGLPASGPKHPPGVFRAYVTPAFQARLARVAVATAQANRQVATFFWFTDSDSAGPATKRIHFFGLRRLDGSTKPAFAALRRAVTELRHTP
jgi:hypothetical protein